MIRLACFALMLSVLAGCAVNPATGRTDFVMMSERQELDLGARYNQQILEQNPPYADAKLQAYIQSVGERVARTSHRSQLHYTFTLVDSPDVNAFALPGGYIYIHRGLLAYLNSEAELAAVLGHEIGHVTARHSVRQQSQSTAWSILGQAAAMGTGMGALNDLTQVMGGAIVRGYGRDMELEADGLGAQYLARSGYDPKAMIEVVKVLKSQEDYAKAQARDRGEAVPESGYHGLFDTHPDNDRRLREVVLAAQSLTGNASQTERDAFMQRLDGLVFGDSAEAGIRRGERFYHQSLDMTLAFPKGWSLINQSDVLAGLSPDRQVQVLMRLQKVDERLSPEMFLRKVAAGAVLSGGQRFSASGVEGYSATVQSSRPIRAAAVYHGDNAYLFVASANDVARLQSELAGIEATWRSLRKLKSSEKALAQPLRLQVERARSGQGLEQLAATMPEGSGGLAQLRLLNNRYPDGDVKAGEWVKTLR